jgi:hypothetical protein
MKKWIFNPFTYIAGWQALFIGAIIMTVTLIVAYYSGTHFNGAIDAHVGRHTSFMIYLLEQVIAWGCPVLVFYALAFLLSVSSFRFIDIAGTIALARAPMLLVAVIGFAPALQNVKPDHVDNMVLILGLLMTVPVIWMVALMYNAFAISFNLKGTKAIIGFISGLITAEVLSLILNHLLQQYIH